MITATAPWMIGVDIAAYFVMTLFCFAVFFTVFKMYRLSGHRGIFYLAISQLMYGIGFLALTIVKILPLCPLPINIITYCVTMSSIVFAYGLTIASLYLLYSMLYKNISYSHKLIQVLLHILALSIAVLTHYGHIQVLIIAQLLILIPALYFTHATLCSSHGKGCLLYCRVISVLILVWAVEFIALVFPQIQIISDALVVLAGGIMLYIVLKITRQPWQKNESV